MEKFIEVYDDILNPNLVDYIEAFIQNPPQDFQYNFLRNVTNPNHPTLQPGFLHSLLSINTPPTPYNPLFNQILYNFCFSKNINLKKIYNSRVFLQLPLPMGNVKEEKIHIDIEIPHMVCLYYINDSDGDTILYKDDEKTEIKRVTPKKGRIVFFDGSIKHCGSFPTKTYRSIVNFDFLGEKF
jgi:hypothetical protein